MGTFGDGAWKEGRSGAASLCYRDLGPGDLELVTAHHAAVGIRATLVARGDEAGLATLAARNWDLADDDAPRTALAAVDGRVVRGVVRRTAAPTDAAAYAVVPGDGVIETPPHGTCSVLPGRCAPPDIAAARAAIDAVATRGAWAVWLIDGATLAAWTPDGHRGLLAWLGSQHARIWCAPVRDIAAW